MVVKRQKTRSDDFSSWSRNEVAHVDDEKRSIALSVNLLLKNISQANLRRFPSHHLSSPACQCQRSFHLFCTDLFDDNELDMINTHPAPRSSERGEVSRRISTPHHKARHRHREDNDQDTIVTTRSEPCRAPFLESQLLDKKLRVPQKLPSRTTSLNVPVATSQLLQTTLKYSPSIQLPKQTTSVAQLHIRASSVFDQSPSTSQMFPPRGPPPSPKTPTQDLSMVISHSIIPPPLRAVSIAPRARNSTEHEKRLLPTTTTIPPSSVKTIKYEDHAREYLSASDCSDNENDDDVDDGNDKDIADALTITKPKYPARQASLSRPSTALRDRLVAHNANHYLSLAQVYYSSLDVYKNLAERSRQRYKAQTRSTIPTNENVDAYSTITKTTTTKTAPVPPSKSVFGFSKTASSMHFGHAAGRLGLHGSFEKWPRPLSRRTPFERKQEVTTLRLVTLPLVTS